MRETESRTPKGSIFSNRRSEVRTFSEQSSSEGIANLLHMIETKGREKGEDPIVVMVAGRTSAGKTTAVTAEITRMFGDAKVLSMDDYSKGNSFVNEMAARGTPINWDHPAYMDFDLLNQHLAVLKKGETIDKPTFSFKTGERAQSESFEPAKVIVVEGLFALRPEIQQHGDVKAFVDISLHGSIVRRLLRDVQRTNMEPTDILRYYLSTVEPMYQEHIVDTKQNADIVLVNEYNPYNEAERSGVYEVQAKFQDSDILRKLRKAGAEFLGEVKQEDHYLQPKHKDIEGESIRVRKQNGVSWLGYKGPQIASDVRTRAKLEFAIDEEIERTLFEKYGDRMQTVSKKRQIFQLDGVTVVVDSDVLSQKGNEARPLGDFVEIRTADKEKGAEKIQQVSERLDLDYDSRINSSYCEL